MSCILVNRLYECWSFLFLFRIQICTPWRNDPAWPLLVQCTVRKLMLKPSIFWGVFWPYNGLGRGGGQNASCGGPLPGFGSWAFSGWIPLDACNVTGCRPQSLWNITGPVVLTGGFTCGLTRVTLSQDRLSYETCAQKLLFWWNICHIILCFNRLIKSHIGKQHLQQQSILCLLSGHGFFVVIGLYNTLYYIQTYFFFCCCLFSYGVCLVKSWLVRRIFHKLWDLFYSYVFCIFSTLLVQPWYNNDHVRSSQLMKTDRSGFGLDHFS